MPHSFLPAPHNRPFRRLKRIDEEIIRGKAEGETACSLAHRLGCSSRSINRRWSELEAAYELTSPVRLVRFARRHSLIKDTRNPYSP